MTADDFIKGALAIRNGGFTVADVTRALERVNPRKRESMSEAKSDGEFIDRLKTMPIQDLSRTISDLRDESTIFIVEIRPASDECIDAQAHGVFNNKTTTKVNVLTALTFALREFAGVYEAELVSEGGEVTPPKTALSEHSYKAHGIKHVIYDPQSIIEAVRSVLAILQCNSQRRVTALGVAGLLVRMQAELAGDTVENTIELMRVFIDNMLRDPKMPKA